MIQFHAKFSFLFALALIILSGIAPAQPTGLVNEMESPAVARGRLITEDGSPAGNVSVLLEISDMRIRRVIAEETVRTSIDGKFTFDLAKYNDIPRLGLQFNCISPRYQQAIVIKEANQDELPIEVEMTVHPGSVAQGRVMDSEGLPIEDVEVFGYGLRPVFTDSEGEFEIFGLIPNGRTSLRFFKEGFSEAMKNVSSESPSLIEGIEIVLQSAAKLRGVAVDPLGDPIKRGEVFLSKDDRFRREKLNSKGEFTFDAVPVKLDGYRISLNTENFPHIDREITPTEAKNLEVKLTTSWPLQLAGKVLKPDNSPAAGSTVIVYTENNSSFEFPANFDGTWKGGPFSPGENLTVISLPTSPRARNTAGELEFTHEMTAGKWAGNVNPWPGGYKSEFIATMEGDKVTMERKDAGSGGLPGRIVYTGELSENFQEISGTVLVEDTGATGEFKARAYGYSGSLKGMWDIREQIEEGQANLAPAKKTLKGAPFPGAQILDLQLTRPLSLSGTVVDPAGSPIPLGEVHVTAWDNDPYFTASTDIVAGGKFLLEGLPEGALTVYVFDDGGSLILGPEYLRGGLEEITLSAAGPAPDPMDEIDLP